MECQEIGVELVASLTHSCTVHQIVRSQSLLEVIPVFLLLPLVVRRVDRQIVIIILIIVAVVHLLT